jgi:hypothetical protein
MVLPKSLDKYDPGQRSEHMISIFKKADQPESSDLKTIQAVKAELRR